MPNYLLDPLRTLNRLVQQGEGEATEVKDLQLLARHRVGLPPFPLLAPVGQLPGSTHPVLRVPDQTNQSTNLSDIVPASARRRSNHFSLFTNPLPLSPLITESSPIVPTVDRSSKSIARRIFSVVICMYEIESFNPQRCGASQFCHTECARSKRHIVRITVSLGRD